MFTLAISFDHFQFSLIRGPNISCSYAILLFTASDFTSITSHINNWVFLLWKWWDSLWAISTPKRWCFESASLNMSANFENSAVATGWERSIFIPIPKRGNAKECSIYCTIALISHASKIMLKILQARLQWYVNCELPDVRAGFRKGRGSRNQIASIHRIIKKARGFQKNIYFYPIDYTKAFDCVDHNKLWKILQEMGILDHLTYLLRNLHAGQ